MQLAKNNSQHNQQLIEKIIRDKQGRLVLATFCVYEQFGRVKARLVSATYLDENVALENKTFALSGFTVKQPLVTEVIRHARIISPYFNILSLDLSGTKPRAPTFA
jgi:hypothetical protein